MQIVSEPIHDDTDRRIMGALHAVDVPADLQTRLERALQVAVQEQVLLESHLLAEAAKSPGSGLPDSGLPGSLLWNRRGVIAAAVAAGLGGIILGYRQLTQPLSQSLLAQSTQSLLDQLKRTAWQELTAAEAVVIRRSLQDIGFFSQVRGVMLMGVSRLQPPRSIQHATAYDFGNGMVLFDLTIERGVQRVSQALCELAWSRSDTLAFAMSSGQRTLVFAGPASIRQKNILPAQTT